MRIGIWHNLSSGGAKRALYDHVKGLIELGHTVESWSPPGALPSRPSLGDLVKEHVVKLKSMDGKSGSLFSRLQNKLDVKLRFRKMAEHCALCAHEMEEAGMEIIFANTCSAFAVSPLGRLTKLPALLYLQDPVRSFYEAVPNNRWAALDVSPFSLIEKIQDFWQTRLARLYVREEIRNAKSYDRILVNSSFSRESILRAYGLESTVCYLGVDTSLFSRVDVPVKFQFVSVGGLHYAKGADRCIRALGQIPLEKRPAFVWIGHAAATAYQLEMEALAKELGVDFSVRANVSDEELVATLSESLAMIYLPRLEPFGYAPLEANSCGLPVVALAEGGVRETVEDGVNGYLARSADPQELADICLRIIDNPIETEALGKFARLNLETKWNLAQSILALEDSILKVINTGSFT